MITNKTVIISCAGMGKRLSLGIPKALVEVDNKPLIIRTLEQLNDVEDVRIVVGYQAEKVIDVVKKYRNDVTFVFNHNYMNTGTGASVSFAVDGAREYVLTIDGDLIVHPDDMKILLNLNYECICGTVIGTDDPVKATVKDGNVVEFSRDHGDFEWTGVCHIKTEHITKGDKHVYQLLEPILPLKHLFIRTKEIDTINDFYRAEKWVKNNFNED